MRYKLFPIVACLTIAGCAPVIWDKPGVTQAQFNQENAQCRMVARGMNPGTFYAEGKPAFVAGAALGNAIGTAINTAATYRDCMMATGYTPENPQTQANVAKIKPILAQTSACVVAVYSAPEAEPIRLHSPYNPAETTPEQLADRAFVTDSEIAIIGALYPRLVECQQNTLRQISTPMPSLVPMLSAQYATGAEEITLLKSRKLTWGDFNTRRKNRLVDFQARLTAELGKPQ